MKYRVSIEKINYGTIEVDAESFEDACSKAESACFLHGVDWDRTMHLFTDAKKVQKHPGKKLPGDGTPTSEKQTIAVNTPIGAIHVTEKSDPLTEYPGVYIEFIGSDNCKKTVACVEYTPDENTIAVDVFPDDNYCERFHCRDISTDDLYHLKSLISEFSKKEYAGVDADFSDLQAIPLAYCEPEGLCFPVKVQVNVDLVNFNIDTYISPFYEESYVHVSSYHHNYSDLQQLLSSLDYSSITSVNSEEWANFAASETGKNWLKENFPINTSIRVVAYNAEYSASVVEITKDGIILAMREDTGEVVELLFGEQDFYLTQ